MIDNSKHMRADRTSSLYQLITSQARDIILLMHRDGRIIEANAAAVEVYGYPHEELIRLDVLMGKPDRFTLLGREFTARFFPDYARVNGDETSRSQEMRDPVLRLATTSPGGETTTAGLRPRDEMPVGALKITFVDWRYWVRLYVRSERGLGLVWMGFALGAAGLVWLAGAACEALEGCQYKI